MSSDKNNDELIYMAWRESESYQVPMTDNGAELADQRFYGFKKGWEYAKFHTENGHVYMKDEDEQDL